ncbi:MAG TPA: hypothetical protein VK897_26475 [Anaerolineales bacterium]|nr:hypothetical protein [Anaerolineales bacterium]
MKRLLLTLPAIFVIFGSFALTGYAGYRLGYDRGVQASSNANGRVVRPFDRFERPRLDEFSWGRNFNRDRGPRVFIVRGFRFFAPLLFLGFLAVLGLIIGFVYWMLRRNSQQFARAMQAAEAPPPPAETERQE